jgi:hypothetical protein
MFKELELVRQYCLGGLSVLPSTAIASSDFQRGQRAGLQMAVDYIEREQERIIKEAMDADDRFIDSFNAPDVVGRR